MADVIKMEVPYFQTPNDIFDLEIEIKAEQIKKNGDKKETVIVKRPMKPQEKLVYIYFCRCGNNGSRTFPSYNKIANKCGLSRRTAIDAVGILKNNNFIVKRFRQKVNSSEQDTNEYFVLDPKSAFLGSAEDAPPSVEGAPPVVHDVHHPSAGDAPKKELIKKNQIKKETIKYSTQFLEWFELYPNKCNKEQTFKNFKTLLKTETFENLMTSTRNYISYIEDKKVDKQFIFKSTNFVGQKKAYKDYLEMDQQQKDNDDWRI